MKKLLMATGSALLLTIASTAHCAEGLYVSGNVGASIPVDSDMIDSAVPGLTMTFASKTGIAAGIALGYDFGNNTRLEAEYAYQQNDMDTVSTIGVTLPITAGDTTVNAGLINGYYDFANGSAFTPFISAGAGLAKIDVSPLTIAGATSTAIDDTVFAYQASVGVGFAASPTVTIDVKYRYFGTADPTFTYPGGTVSGEYSSHNFYGGVRIAF